jgi:signal transduction histidine kinase
LTLGLRAVERVPQDPGAIPAGRWVVLSVEDEGRGMTAEALARAGEPGFTTKPPGRGTGLGLAGVVRMVKRAGGHLRIESAPGEGTRVHLWLPA